MPTESVIQRSFVAGEISPAMGARADQTKYTSGLRTCRNFLVLRHGGVANRPGTRYVATAKLTTATRLMPFIFEGDDQTYMIEMGELYFRWFFHGAPVVVAGVAAWNGGTDYVVGDLVVQGGVNYYCILLNTGNSPPNATFWYPLTGDIYEVPTPYTAAQVKDVRFVQSTDVLTLTHASHAPQDLQRQGHTTWVLETVVTQPSVAVPTGLAVAKGASGTLTQNYVISAAKKETFEESYASASAGVTAAAEPTEEAPNLLTWDAHADAEEFYVHKDSFGNGIYGYIGTSTSNAFKDIGFSPDYTVTPPVPRALFVNAGEFPRVASYYQQRLLFANSIDEPEKVWASAIGSFRNFSVSTPLQDDDAVTWVLASMQLNPVAHLVPLAPLVVLTDAGEWLVLGDDTGTLLPTRINAIQKGFVGALANLRPVVVGSSMLYVQARGTRLRDFRTADQEQEGRDLTVFADHLFKAPLKIVGLAYAQEPLSIVWACRSDGVLLGVTYLRDHDVLGWHRHDTGASGKFEDVQVIPDTSIGEDVPYFVVQRTVNGATVRYIEHFASRNVASLDTDAFFVDSGLSYTGAPATVFSGLEHLEAEIVAVLADGQVVFDGDPDASDAEDYRVTGGAITLPMAATEVHIGLPIRFAEIETLSLDVSGTAIRDKKKRLQSLTVLVEASGRGFLAGPDASNLLEQKEEYWEPDPGALVTGQLELSLTASFVPDGRVIIRHTDPLPFTVLGVLPHLELGGG